MNPFFAPHGDVKFDVPSVAFARFEQSEPPDIAPKEECVVILTGVSADWLSAQRRPMYRLSDLETLRAHWGSYWRQVFKPTNGETKPEALPDPYADMPFLRYEVTRRWFEKKYDLYRGMAGDESSWFRIELDPESPVVAQVYGSVFGDPQEARISTTRVDKDTARALSAMFDMDLWPDAHEQEIAGTLETVARRAEGLVAFDIGQGSASALVDEDQRPFIYHDLGAGITRNARTTPVPLQFCWTNRPVIVLSHWDKDHWAGALKDPKALQTTWIVPRQKIPPPHSAFGSQILSAGGRILVWPQSIPPMRVRLYQGQSMTVGRCTGVDRNGSGIAIRVDDDNHGDTLHWLMTGDAGYDQVPFALRGRVAAMTVPHHGAKMRTNSWVPRGPGGAYGRLLYSFGPGNAHGQTNVRHPTSQSVAEHQRAGWNSGTWRSNQSPGRTLAGGDVLATGMHMSTHLSGAIAGWTGPFAPKARLCRLLAASPQCTTVINQS